MQITWIQEEHRNQGAYSYIRDRLALALDLPLEEIRYCGRLPSAAPATGSKMTHQNEHQEIMTQAMSFH